MKKILMLSTILMLNAMAFASTEYKFSGQDAMSQLEESNSCVDCDLSGADLSNMNLRGSDFSASDLTGANLSGSDITGAWFKGAILKDVNTTDTIMSKGQPALFKKRS